MALAALGAVSATHTATADPVDLDLSTDIAVGTTVIVPFGGDSNSVSLSSVSDSNGNSWDAAFVGEGQGNAGIAWSTLTTALASTDIIRLKFNKASDCMARAYAFTGITAAEINEATKGYTESATFSLGMSGSAGVQFCVFAFPVDYFTTSISGWTRFSDIQDGTDQQLLAYYKEVSSGTQTCSRTIGSTIAYLAAGVRLPLGSTTTPAPGTTTTPAPSVALGSQVISFF